MNVAGQVVREFRICAIPLDVRQQVFDVTQGESVTAAGEDAEPTVGTNCAAVQDRRQIAILIELQLCTGGVVDAEVQRRVPEKQVRLLRREGQVETNVSAPNQRNTIGRNRRNSVVRVDRLRPGTRARSCKAIVARRRELDR